MGKILKLRVILDVEAGVFRDIEIEAQAPLAHLHAATLDAFGWAGMEMASFYKSNAEWDRGDEIPLVAMPDGEADRDMDQITVGELLPDLHARAVYVYDFLRMWCFFIEPLNEVAPEPGAGYPRLTLEFGVPPAPESRAPEGVDDADLLAALGLAEEEQEGDDWSTGDAELDAYRQASGGHHDDEDDGGPTFTNIDDLDDIY